MTIRLIGLSLLALAAFACGGATEPEEAPYYVGEYQCVDVNGWDAQDLGINFTVTFNTNMTADLHFQYGDVDNQGTGVYDLPDDARDSELRLNEPYTDVYAVHWSGGDPAQQVVLIARDVWTFERVN